MGGERYYRDIQTHYLKTNSQCHEHNTTSKDNKMQTPVKIHKIETGDLATRIQIRIRVILCPSKNTQGDTCTAEEAILLSTHRVLFRL